MGRAKGNPFYWNFCTTTFDGITPVNASNTANAPGISFSTPASADTDGTAVTLLSALAHDVHRVVIHIGGLILSGGFSCAIGDLLADPAGGTSWTPIWNDIICGNTPVPSAANGGIQTRYELPLYIKAGTSLGWRARCHNASAFADGRVTLACYGEPSNPREWWCGQAVETLGSTPGSSNGTQVDPGDSGANGTWTNVGSGIIARYGAICLGAQGDVSVGLAQTGYRLQVGYDSVKLPGSPDMWMASTTGEAVIRAGGFLGDVINCGIKAGTQMQVRATQTAAATNTVGVILYGAY